MSQLFVEKYLNKIVNYDSPSGRENDLCDYFLQSIAKYVNEVKTDILGNVIAIKKGQSSQKIMIVAHADEVGFMVTNIDEHGFVYIRPIGGIDVRVLPAMELTIIGYKEKVKGVVGINSFNTIGREIQVPKFEELWVDIGSQSKEETCRKVRIGDYVTYSSKYNRQGDSIICGKSLDDKIGLAVILSLAEQLRDSILEYNVYFVASTQEELGCRGVQSATNTINPDICIVIDVTNANDFPTATVTSEIKLGKGVVITVGPNIDKSIGDALIKIAEENAISYQIEPIPYATSTDARVIQNSHIGVRTALLSIPCRYIHTPVEMVSLNDSNGALSLMLKYLTKL